MAYPIRSKVVSEQFEDEAIVVDLEKGSYYSFRGSAFGIWKMVEGGFNQDQIVLNSDDQQETKTLLEYLIKEELVDTDDVTPSSSPIEGRISGIPEYNKYDDMKDLLLLDPIHEVDKKGWPNKSQDE
jgi:hypothetical protein